MSEEPRTSPEEIARLSAELAALRAQYGEIKGTLVFLGHNPEELDNLGGIDE